MKIWKKLAIGKCTQTVGDTNELDEIMRLNLFIQTIFGLQILHPSWTWKRALVNKIISTALWVYVLIGTWVILRDLSDIKLIAEAFYTYIISVTYQIKFYLFVNKKNKFRKIFVDLKSTLFEILRNDSQEKLDNVLDKVKKFVHVMYYLFFFPVLMYVMTALWFYMNGELITLSKTTSILMPMKTPYYEIALIMHGTFMFEASFTIIVIDLWFVILMYFFLNACDSTVKILHVDKKYEDEDSTDYAIRLNDHLRRFHKIHVKQVE